MSCQQFAFFSNLADMPRINLLFGAKVKNCHYVLSEKRINNLFSVNFQVIEAINGSKIRNYFVMFATYSFTNSTNPYYIYISGNCISLYLLLKSGIYANIILHNKNCHITPTVVIWLKIEVSGCGCTNSAADHFSTII